MKRIEFIYLLTGFCTICSCTSKANSEIKEVITEVHNTVTQAAAGGPGLQVKSPLPGTILSVNVKEGDRVAPRQTLFVLEAMKMENNIDAERGGVVKSIHVQKGATVMEGDLLIVIE